MFSSLYQAEKFKKYLSSQHSNFSLEKENDGRLSILEANIFCEKGKLVTNFYWKITFSGVYINFNSFIPGTYKTDLVKSLLFRRFNLCLDFVKFRQKLNFLKCTLFKNNYLRNFVYKFASSLLKVRMVEILGVSAYTGKE